MIIIGTILITILDVVGYIMYNDDLPKSAIRLIPFIWVYYSIKNEKK